MTIKSILRFSLVAILIATFTLIAPPLSGNSTTVAVDCSNVNLNQACAMYHALTRDFVFSPVANEIAFVSNFIRATIISVPSGEMLREYVATGGFGTDLAYSPDGNTLAIATEDGVSIWNLVDDSKSYIETSVEVYSVDFSPDGQMMGLGLSDGTIALLNTDSHEIVASAVDNTFRFGSAVDVVFAPNGKLIATSSIAGVRLWTSPDLTLTEHHLLDIPARIDFSNDGRYLSLATYRIMEVPIWEINDSSASNSISLQMINNSDNGANHAVFSPDGNRIGISLDDYNLGSPALSIWDVESQTIVQELVGFGTSAADGIWSYDGSYFALTISHRENFTGAPLSIFRLE